MLFFFSLWKCLSSILILINLQTESEKSGQTATDRHLHPDSSLSAKVALSTHLTKAPTSGFPGLTLRMGQHVARLVPHCAGGPLRTPRAESVHMT